MPPSFRQPTLSSMHIPVAAFASPATLLPRTAGASATEKTTPVCLNKRSEAARRRWQDPEYRAKMRAARARNVVVKRSSSDQPERQAGPSPTVPPLCGGVGALSGMAVSDGLLEQEGVIEIGVGDSITHCDDEKAAAINSYVFRNQLRREKLQMFHHDKQRWMDTKLQKGEGYRMLIMSDDVKRERQLARQEQARKRHARIRAKKEAEMAGGSEQPAAVC